VIYDPVMTISLITMINW